MSTTTSVDPVLAQYEKNNAKFSDKPKLTKEELFKRYFNLQIPEGKTEIDKRIRILPSKDGTSPFKEVWFHELQVKGEWIKLYDPKKNDNDKNPIADLEEALLATKKDDDKELAKKYKSRKFYVVKVIDRDNEADGPKVWRFKHNWKQKGIFDMIMPIWKQKGDLSNAETGRDLILSLYLAKTPAGKSYVDVKTIMYEDAAALSKDTEQAKKWLEDDLDPRNAYSKKPYEYLDAIAHGEVPKWNTDLKKYTYGNSTSETSVIGATTPLTTQSEPVASSSEITSGEEPSDDLPF